VPPNPLSRWEDACTAAAIVAVDPLGVGGISLRSAPGPIRDRWLALLARLGAPHSNILKIPLNISDSRLLGGLDLAATLKAGRPVEERGILTEADRGMVILAMAERLTPAAAAKITSVQDACQVTLERDGFARRIPTRFGVVALDEGIDDDERPPAGLLDRLGVHVDLAGIPVSVPDCFTKQVLFARERLAAVRNDESVLMAFCETAEALGIHSARAPLLALRVARAAAALAGRTHVWEADVELAARIVLAPRATTLPEDVADQQPQSESAPTNNAEGRPEPPPDDSEAKSPNSLSDRVVQAAAAALPPHLLSQLRNATSSPGCPARQGKRANSEKVSLRSGRPSGTRVGDPRCGARLSLIETLRAAAPWQAVRAAMLQLHAIKTLQSPKIRVLKEDFRVVRFKRRDQQTTIFLVDASGSAALNRLAEVKGAVELMLADSYIHRDRVALISFRGTGAQLLLPPTSSLVRAKRELASLPGGGGTPMASGLDTARQLADSLQRRGEAPVVVVLTDGRPNIARDGKGDRVLAEKDTFRAARMIRDSSISSLLVDTAPQPRVLTEQFAHEMGARYLSLPYVNAGVLAGAVRGSGSDRRMRSSQIHAQ